MAAQCKEQLLDVTAKEFAKLEQLMDQVDEDFALVADEDETSIKDIVGHRAHWIGLFFGWYGDGLAGNEVFFPAKGYKWNDLKRFNAQLRVEQLNLGWSEVCSNLRDAHNELIAFITSRTDADLYSGPMAGAKNHWTPGRWAEAAGPSHYRSAAKYIRARQRTKSASTSSV